MGGDKEFEMLDILNIINFAITLENYGKNVNQSKLQEVMNSAVEDIHKHLKEQDKKIDRILESIQGGNNSDGLL